MFLMNRIRLGGIALALGLGSGPSVADVVAVLSSNSSVTTLSRDQVTDIFLGRASRFANGEPAVPLEQCARSGPVYPLARDHNRPWITLLQSHQL